MVNVCIVHGWKAGPESFWYPWLKKELVKRGFKVTVPKLPNANVPKISAWISKIRSCVKDPKNTILVCHSLGCRAGLKLVENLRLRGIICVAGFVKLNPLEITKIREAKPWLKPVRFGRIKCPIVVILSSNDHYVPVKNSALFRRVGARVIILKNRKHFADKRKIPVLLKEVLAL